MEKQRRLRTWLFNIIDSGKVENLEWLNEEKNLFKIPWKHESRNDWLPSHAQVFTEWAKFTGKYREGIDKPDYKMFKTRLRCAFNKAPDIEEETDERKYKGPSPYRVYKLLPCDKKPMKKESSPSVLTPMVGVTQPPLTVEQLQAAEGNTPKTTRTVLAEKIKNRMDLERQREDSVWSKQEQPDTMEELVEANHCPQPVQYTEVKDSCNQQYQAILNSAQASLDYKEEQKTPMTELLQSRPEPVVSKGNGEQKSADQSADNQNSQSLILLQSTRYRCTLLKNMYELQKNGFLCDLLLRASGGTVVPVHANVMCASSGFFKEKVDHWDIGHSGDTAGGCMVLEFEEIPFEILSGIIQFIYLGEFEVAREGLPHILALSRQMQLEDLTILCEHVLKALRGSFVDEKTKKPVLPKQPPLMSERVQQVPKQQIVPSAPIPAFLCQKEDSPPIVLQPHQPNIQQPKNLTPPGFTHPLPIPSFESTNKTTAGNSPQLVSPSQTSPVTPETALASWHIPHQGEPECLKFNPEHEKQNSHASRMVRSLPSHYPDSNDMHMMNNDQVTRQLVPPQMPRSSSGRGVVDYPNSDYQRSASLGGTIYMNSPMPNPLHVLCQAVDETIRSESQSDEDASYEADKVTPDLKTAEKTVDLPSFRRDSSTQQKEDVTVFQQVQQNQQPKHLVQAIPPVVLPHQPSQVKAAEPTGLHSLPSDSVPDPVTLAVQAGSRYSKQGPPKDDMDLYQCKYCSKAFQHVTSRNNHQSNCHQNMEKVHGISNGSVQSLRRSSHDGSLQNKEHYSVSEETIQEIVQRIKEKAGPEGATPQTLPTARKVNQGFNGRQLRSNARKYHKVIRPKEVIVIDDEERNQSSGSQTGSYGRIKENEREGDRMNGTEGTSGFPNPKRLKTSNPEKKKAAEGTGRGDTGKRPGRKPVDIRHLTRRQAVHKLNVTCQECGLSMTSVGEVEEHKSCCKVATAPLAHLNHICDQCGKMFEEEGQLEQHILKHDKLRSLTCSQCKKVCKSALLLKLHIEVHACHKMKFSCMACGKCFITKKKLETHIQRHLHRNTDNGDHQGGAAVYECAICQEKFKLKRVLMRHLATHEQEQAATSDTSNAEQTKLNSGGLIRKTDIFKPVKVDGDQVTQSKGLNDPENREIVTNSENGFDADNGNSTPDETSSSLRGTAEMSKKCHICNDMFLDHVKKMVHLMSHFQFHTDPNKVICQICLTTVDKNAIMTHELSHAKETPLECPHCDGAFSDSTELNSHVNEDHCDAVIVTEHACEKCCEVFSSKEELMEHSLIHFTTSRAKDPLVCEVCQRVFTSKYATYEYKRHMYTHTGEKPIACRFCDKGFKDYSGRSQHEKRVHNRGPLSRGRTKGNRGVRSSFVKAVPQANVQVLGSNPTKHGPPPLVNINMLSEEVKNQFFPSLRPPAAAGREASGSDEGGSAEAHNVHTVDPHMRKARENGENLSEEEDLSIIMAMKGESPPQMTAPEKPYQKEVAYQQSFLPRNHLPIATPPSYRPALMNLPPRHTSPSQGHHQQRLPTRFLMPTLVSPAQQPPDGAVARHVNTTGLLLQTSVGLGGNIQYTLHPASATARGPAMQEAPVELLSHLTTSKGNPVVSPGESPSAMYLHSGPVASAPPQPAANRAIVSTCQRPIQTATRLARVGNRLKISTMVAPTVRHPQPSPIKQVDDDSCNKLASVEKVGEMSGDQEKPIFYPTLPKKRPYVPVITVAEDRLKSNNSGFGSMN